MPRFPKAFARRKSSANVFEDVGPEVPAVEHSFKVFERGDTASKSFDGGVKLAKTGPPNNRPRTSQLDTENMFENLGKNRGSGASNNTSLTTDNSSRLSAASTAPSSTDNPGRDEWKSAHDKPYDNIPLPPVPRSTSSFSLKNAGRTLSWGRNKPMPPSPKGSESPKSESRSSGRERAVTASSYASTAKPPVLEKDLGLSLGGDFADMFSGFDKRRSTILDAEESRAMSQSPEILSPGPASRLLTNRQNPPSSLSIDKQKDIEPSPYSWSSQHSREGLISRFSPSHPSPRQDDTPPPPPVPAHGPSRVNNDSTSSFARIPRKDVGETALRRTSAQYGRRQSVIDDSVDEDARLLKESANASRRMNDPGYKVRDSWALPSTSGYKIDDSTIASWRTGSTETTPKAKRTELRETEDNLFDNQIAASANLAQKYQERAQSAPMAKQAPLNRVMTPAQFERYKQDQERLRSFGGQSKDDADEDEEETYDDDEDETEKARQMAKQRRKQEAHMAVYRQQMMKVTGEAVPVRPNMFASQSSPNLVNSGDGEEEDEEVPLGILQAHGFPNKNKPPMRNSGSNPNLRAPSAMGGGGGALPVFARNLPQDPYFGAGLVNPMHRESLAFGVGSAASVSGEPSRGLPPGGLVGVIATEERSRAMRRGSPNAQGGYAQPPPSNGFNGMQAPPSGAGSMYNGMGPMGMMNPMMMTPGDQAQIQMSQQMQQFMAMQMQFMQMMTTGQGAPSQSGHQPHNSIGEIPRPGSANQMHPVNPHQRTMTMMEPNAAPWMNRNSMYTPSLHGNGGYAPSIAPSERSNVGLPGRYRPVSHAPPLTHQNKVNIRTSTMMSGGLGGWGNKLASKTIRPVKKAGNGSDEDDDEGWEEMTKKREKKKSSWRTKKDKDPIGLKETLGYVQ